MELLQVLDVVKTRQTTYSVLSSLRKYLQNLEKSGLLEKKETLQIDDDVQVWNIGFFKEVLRNEQRTLVWHIQTQHHIKFFKDSSFS